MKRLTSLVRPDTRRVALLVPIAAGRARCRACGRIRRRRRPPMNCCERRRSIASRLIDGTVMIVDPVSPRPLPTYDPAKEREKKRRRERNEIPLEGNIIVGETTKIEHAEREEGGRPEGLEEDDVKLHLLQGGPRRLSTSR